MTNIKTPLPMKMPDIYRKALSKESNIGSGVFGINSKSGDSMILSMMPAKVSPTNHLKENEHLPKRTRADAINVPL
jgi:hypothetical protein